MLLLLFNTFKEQYAINCALVREVIPYLNLQPIPMTPSYIRGAVNLRGTPIPVIDLSKLLDHKSCRSFLSTRIILINYTNDSSGAMRTIGLLAEKVTDTVKTPKNWSPDLNNESPYFIDLTIINREMVQWFEPTKMLPKDLAKILFMEYSYPKDLS